jgi:hypothetical protein
MLSKKLYRLSWDHLGGFLSFLCMIHCLVLPWLLIMLPFALLLDEYVHLWLFLAITPTAALAAWSGFRQHRQHLPAIFILLGVFLVGIAALRPIGEGLEVTLTVVGSLLLIFGHVHNGRLRDNYRLAMQIS